MFAGIMWPEAIYSVRLTCWESMTLSAGIVWPEMKDLQCRTNTLCGQRWRTNSVGLICWGRMSTFAGIM